MASELAALWPLDPAVTFLNHGSFGATPTAVLAAQDRWRRQMEREPVAFFARDYEPALDGARAALGAFVGADPDDLAFVANATAGINIVARSLDLDAGDEIVVLDHAYNAARNALEAAAEASGARVVTASLPFPGTTPDLAMTAVLGAIGPRTRLVLLDHVTSPTALVLPVGDIVAALRERGVETLVDAAHAPGMLELDLDATGAAYTTGNLHKWTFAPKGSAFLHVRRDLQDHVRPIVISHGANSSRTDRSPFRLEHDWIGTLDPTPWLAVPAAIDFGARLVPGGWPSLRARQRNVALEGRAVVCQTIRVAPPCADDMIGAMAAVPLPTPRDEVPAPDLYADRVHRALVADGIQVAIGPWPMAPDGRSWQRVVRFSCPPYIGLEDIRRLATSLASVLAPA
jgi:isopenicillin-N epimerase